MRRRASLAPQQRTADIPAPKRIEDLMALTGFSRDLCVAGILDGSLPGYKVGSRYTIPGPAFELLATGQWQPNHRHVIEFATVPAPRLVHTLADKPS